MEWGQFWAQFWFFYKIENKKPQQDTKKAHKVGLPSLTDGEPAGNTTTEVKSAGFALIPFYRCHDPHKSAQWKVQHSPFYKLYRETYWKCVTWGSNGTSVEQGATFESSEQTGTTSTETQAFSTTFGVKVSVSAGEPGVGSFSAEVSASIGFTDTSSFSRSFKYGEIRTFPCKIAPNTASSVWLLVNKYTLKRLNGSSEEVVSTYEINDGSDLRFSQYPPPKNSKPEDSIYHEGPQNLLN